MMKFKSRVFFCWNGGKSRSQQCTLNRSKMKNKFINKERAVIRQQQQFYFGELSRARPSQAGVSLHRRTAKHIL